MHLPKRVWSAMSASCAALAVLASGLAGCSGGGSTAVTPLQQPAQPAGLQPQSENLTVLSVDRSTAGAVAAKVTASTAHAFLINGAKPQALNNQRRPLSGGPNDLQFFGGPVITSEASHNIYVNCGNNCWGGTSPYTFLTNYGASNMIHIVDQYIGSTANGRYTAGSSLTENYDTSGTLQDQDIFNLIHTAAQSYGGGYNQVYHVFLQSGVQQCSASAGGCYAQQYCAYHGSTDFGDVGHVIYSVEPYQGINGCQAGGVVNSTGSTLSHELTELITDPDVAQNNLAWYNNNLGEIGDICGGSKGYVTLNRTQYYIQREYSNRTSSCSFTP